MFEDFFAALCNFQPVEEIAVVHFFTFFCDFILKEAADHKLIQRLAEPSWSRKQSNLRLTFNQFLYHQSLIDKISVFLDYFLKILHTDGDFLLYSITHFFTLPSESLCFLSVPHIHVSIVYLIFGKETTKKSFWIVMQKLLFLYFIVTLLFSTGVL